MRSFKKYLTDTELNESSLPSRMHFDRLYNKMEKDLITFNKNIDSLSKKVDAVLRDKDENDTMDLHYAIESLEDEIKILNKKMEKLSKKV